MTTSKAVKRNKWQFDIIFGVHGAFAVWNLFMALGSGLRLLLPAVSDWLGAAGMMLTLGVWIPVLLLSPVVILASLWFWRDWSVLLLALLIGVYVFTLQYAEVPVFIASATLYTIIAIPLCLRWFFYRRPVW